MRDARRELERCVKADCPEFVRGDCDRWLGEVESALPSVVFGATLDGRDVTDVAVSVDGEKLAERLDGKAVPIDPGRHTVRFVARDAAPVVVEIVVREGEKNRVVVAELARPAKPHDPPPSERALPPSDSPSVLGYVLAGVGVAGLAGFVGFGIAGNAERADLEDSCSPRCSDDDLQPVQTKYLLADISLGVGVVALGAAAYVFLAGGGSAAPKQETVTLDLDIAPQGPRAAIRGRF